MSDKAPTAPYAFLRDRVASEAMSSILVARGVTGDARLIQSSQEMVHLGHKSKISVRNKCLNQLLSDHHSS